MIFKISFFYEPEDETANMTIEERRKYFIEKQRKKTIANRKGNKGNSPSKPKKPGKQKTDWDLSMSSGKKNKNKKVLDSLDFSDKPAPSTGVTQRHQDDVNIKVGAYKNLQSFDPSAFTTKTEKKETKSIFSMFQNLTSRTLTKEEIAPALDKMKEHLISKNVASDIADKLCTSVSMQLDGKKYSSFQGINKEINNAVQDSLTQILTPKRRVDILRDVVYAKQQGRPYVITFCGVNGVGKSTNLAKITCEI